MLVRRWLRVVLAIILLFGAGRLNAQDQVNAQLPWHPPVLDAEGNLLAWYHPEKNQGYDQVLKLGWDFIEHKVPRDTRHGSGLKIYLINAVYDGETLQGWNWQGNPAMVFGSFVDSLAGWYPYSGDEEAIRTVREMLDYALAHGTTPADWDWASVPFTTNCDDQPDYGRCIQDMPREFYGGIETDKLGELGTGYVLFYEMTGERKYLDAALHCAQALARHVRPGDAEHTPWPFRVNAHTGEVLAGEEYGGIVVSSLRLLDELIRLQAGNTASFEKARGMARKWLLESPLDRHSPARDKWSGYFEDVPKNQQNVNQAAPTYTAYYLMTRSDPAAVDKDWVSHVGAAAPRPRTFLRRLGNRRAGRSADLRRLLLALRGIERHVALGGHQRDVLREDRRRPGAPGRFPLAQLLHLFRRFGRQGFLLRLGLRRTVLVQRRLRRLPAALQLGHGRDSRTRAHERESSPTLDFLGAKDQLRRPQPKVPDV
jgi:hypothetical protein